MNLSVFGSPRSYHSVSPIASVRTWSDFLAHLAPTTLPVTRSEYAALPPKAQKEAKRGRYFVAATFEAEGAPSSRRIDKATGLSLVCLDVDDAQHAHTVLARPLPTLPGPHIVYHTASSTPEAPRLRVVVPAPPGAKSSDYPRLVGVLAYVLGLPAVTPESLVAVQPMYAPIRFAEDELMGYDPFVSTALDGPPINFAALSASASIPVAPRVGVGHEIDATDALQFLSAPLDGVTLLDAEKVLSFIDPDLPRDQWIKVMCALQHQFPGDPEALGVFCAWSQKGKKFPGDEDVAREWATRKPNASGRHSFTFRSLIRMAQAAGFRVAESPMAFKAFRDLLAWVKDPARTAEDLWDTALRKVAALPHRSAMEEDSLLQTLGSALSRLGLPASRVALRKSLRQLRATEARGDAETKADAVAVPEWAQGFVYVALADQFYNTRTGARYPQKVFDTKYSRHLCAMGESRPADTPSNYLSNVLKVECAEDYAYLPAETAQMCPHPLHPADSTRLYVNTYRPTYAPADPLHAPQAERLITQHLAHLIAEPEHRATVLDWMAYQVQNPGEKIRWAVVLQGAQGCGKTALAQMLEAALGKGNVRSVSGANVVNSPYNEWMEGAQVIALEEIRVSGHNRTEIMNALKPAITNNTLSVNQKYRDTREAYNVANYLLLTNHHDALAVDDTDRRYFILQSAIQTKAQVLETFPPGYFRTLFEFLRDNPGGVRAFLEEYPVSPSFSPDGPAPVTHYARRMSEVTGSPLAAAVKECLEDGGPLVCPAMCCVHMLRAALQRDHDLGEVQVSDKRLSLALAELGLHRCGRVRVGEQRVTVWSDTLPEDDTSGLVEAYTAAVEMAALMGVAVSI